MLESRYANEQPKIPGIADAARANQPEGHLVATPMGCWWWLLVLVWNRHCRNNGDTHRVSREPPVTAKNEPAETKRGISKTFV